YCCFFFSSRRRHTRSKRDWSSDVCSSDLTPEDGLGENAADRVVKDDEQHRERCRDACRQRQSFRPLRHQLLATSRAQSSIHVPRSEERRVGKECSSRWAADSATKTQVNGS